MKIQIDGRELNSVLKTVKPFIDGRSYLEILKAVKIVAENNIIKIYATDLESQMIAYVDGEVFEEGKICISIKELQQLIKGQKDNIIINDNTIENGMEIKFNALDVEEFPEFVVIEKYKEFEVSNKFIKNLELCLSYCGKDDNRPLYNGVWIDKENFMATDSHSLITCENTEFDLEKEVWISQLFTGNIVKTFKKSNSLFCKISNNNIEMSDYKYAITSKIGAFLIPNYKQVIPKEENLIITLDVDKFNNILDKIPNIEEYSSMTKIRMTINDNVKIRSKAIKETVLNCVTNVKNYSNEEFIIWFDKAKMIRLLNTFKSKEIKLKFFGKNSPFIAEYEGVLSLGLPVRLRDEENYFGDEVEETETKNEVYNMEDRAF
jgi:DNA polymerase-3 subunit beta